MAWRLVAWVLLCATVCAHSSAQVSPIPSDEQIDRCREAAGFEYDDRFTREPSADAVSLCEAVAKSSPRAAAYFARALYRSDQGSRAYEWIQRAVEARLPLGFVLQGIAHQYGYGVPKDIGEALDSYRKAAEAGQVNAQYNLALLLVGREPSANDWQEILENLNAAAAAGYAPALNHAAWLKRRGVMGINSPNPPLDLYARAAAAGDEDAMFNWALLSLDTSPTRALAVLRTTAAGGHCPSRILLADLHRYGRLVPKDRAAAVRLLQPCAELLMARWALGTLASDGSVPGITAQQADDLLANAHEEMDDLLDDRKKPARYWDVGYEPLPREELLFELAQMGSPTTILRRRAAGALRAHEIARRIGREATQEALVDLSSRGNSRQVKKGARMLAEDLGLSLRGAVESSPLNGGRQPPSRGAVPPSARQASETTAVWVRNLTSPDDFVVISTLQRVQTLDVESFEPIRKSLIGSRSPRAKLALVEIAADRRISLPIDVYEAAFNHPKDRIRATAIEAAARNHLQLSSRQLAALARDSSKALFSSAARWNWVLPAELLVEGMKEGSLAIEATTEAAAWNPSPSVRRQLLSLLKGQNRRVAAESLSKVRIGEEAGSLLQILSQWDADSQGDIDYLTRELIKSLEPTRIAPFVVEFLRSPDPGKRRLGLRLAYMSGSQLHGPAATAMVAADPDADVRRAAADLLLNMWRPERIDTLAWATHDVDGLVRVRGLEGLKTDRNRYVQRAIELSADPDPLVRKRVASILSYLEDPASTDAVQRLSTDPDKSVRAQFEKNDSATEVQSELKIWTGLPKSKLLDALCQTAGKHALPPLFDLATDRRSSSQSRQRALYCARFVAKLHGLTEAQIGLLAQILDDPTEDSLDGFTLSVLEQVVNPSAARIVMRHNYVTSTNCAIQNRISSFPEFARNAAAREFLLIPSQLVQQYALECMGGQSTLAKYVEYEQQSRSRRLTPTEVDALTGLSGSNVAGLLLRRLPSLTSENERLALLEALWGTRSELANQHALNYHGVLPVDYTLFSAWAEALASNPTQAALDRLVLELSRANKGHQEAIQSAITLSSRLPSAELRPAHVATVSDFIASNTLGWRLDDRARLFSPLAFLSECMQTEEPRTHMVASDYVNNEGARMLSAHVEALGRVFGQCVAWRASKGLSYPIAFEGIAKKLLLSAGRVQEAAGFGRAVDEATRRDPMSALAEAEVESRLANHSVVLPLLDNIEQSLLPGLASGDESASYFLRLAWLRGHTLAALGQQKRAIPWLNLAAKQGGRNSTGLLATAELIELGVPPEHKTARWMVDEFDVRDQSGSQVQSAMKTITETLIVMEVERINVEQSLLDADRVTAFSMADLRAAPASLGDRDTDAAVRQLVELERHVDEARPRGARAMADAQQRLNIWLADMRIKYPSMTGFLRPQPLQIEELRKALGPDTALVQYLVLPTQSYAWTISGSTQNVVRLNMSLARVYAAVAKLRSGIANGSTSSAEYQQALRELSNGLVVPVLASTTSTHWVIVPHAWLHSVPFAVLPIGDDGNTPLVSRVTISMATRAAAVMTMSRPRPPGENSELLAIGGATEFASSLPPLKFAKEEVQRIAALVPGHSSVKTGPDATRAILLTQEPSVNRSLHLAIHAQALQGDQSRLVFSDGYLTVRDIWGLALSGTPRVVLSACESGLGETLTGNDVLSLASAFLAAGAQSVVSSLWLVRDDERTGQLILDFYAALNRGRSTAEALADAQRAAITAGYPPQIWAAFTAHGL